MTYNCIICNKEYKSYQSLWNHNKKFHKDANKLLSVINKHTSTNISANISEVSDNISSNPLEDKNHNKNYYCRKCNKSYNHIQSRWKHEKKCNYSVNNTTYITSDSNTNLKILQETTKQKQLELELKKEEIKLKKEENKRLKLILKQQTKENETQTISKINNVFIININSNDTKQNNSGIDDYKKPIELQKVMSISRMKYIAKQGYGSLESYIEFLHCGKINQFKNLVITNLKNDIIYVFDSKTCQYIADLKSKVIKSLIDNRMSDIENILGLISNEIDDKTKRIIRNFIKDMQDNKKFINDGITYENYCEFMTEKIILLLYNNHKKVLNDISTYIEKKMSIQDKPTVEEIE